MPEWGGPRPGAGRKPKEPGKSRVTLSTRISEDSSRRLRAYTERTGKSMGQILDELVAFVDGRPDLRSSFMGDEVSVALVAPSTEGTLDGTPEPAWGPSLAELVEHIPASMAYMDTQSILRLVNAEFKALLGSDGNDLVGRSCQEALAHAIDDIDAVVKDVLSGGPARRVVCLGRGTYGDRCFELRVIPYQFDEKQTHGALMTVAVVPVPSVGGASAEV